MLEDTVLRTISSISSFDAPGMFEDATGSGVLLAGSSLLRIAILPSLLGTGTGCDGLPFLNPFYAVSFWLERGAFFSSFTGLFLSTLFLPLGIDDSVLTTLVDAISDDDDKIGGGGTIFGFAPEVFCVILSFLIPFDPDNKISIGDNND